jgi:hypothetical protein
MLLHLPIVILTSMHPTLVADSPPKFDIVKGVPVRGRLKADATNVRG